MVNASEELKRLARSKEHDKFTPGAGSLDCVTNNFLFKGFCCTVRRRVTFRNMMLFVYGEEMFVPALPSTPSTVPTASEYALPL